MYVFVEMLMTTFDKVRYITDISPDKHICLLNEFMDNLKEDYHFNVNCVSEIISRLKCGMPVIIDLLNVKYYKHDGADTVLLKSSVVRRADGQEKLNEFQNISKKIEKVVNKNYFVK